MIQFLLPLLSLLVVSDHETTSRFSQAPKDNPAYVIYTSEGKEVDYSKMFRDVHEADVLFIGELHNNPIIHWIQVEITKKMIDARKGKVMMGAEMFESDNQLIMDEYLKGHITEKNFLNEMRLWSNYETDYRPLVELAKEHELPFIATNVPRRYASRVYHAGLTSLDSLDDDAKQFIAPLPIEYDPNVACYRKMIEMSGGHGGENLPKAQALKDATMAHFILENWKEGWSFIHYNGAYHSDDYQGIVWYVKRQNPSLKIKTITTVLQDDVSFLMESNMGKADYIVCVPAGMTTTH